MKPIPLLLQAIVGTAGGATRAALIQHQARRDNMADVAAKDGSQVCACPCEDTVYHGVCICRRQWSIWQLC